MLSIYLKKKQIAKTLFLVSRLKTIYNLLLLNYYIKMIEGLEFLIYFFNEHFFVKMIKNQNHGYILGSINSQ